jgi:sec-independent protein translocase protein TatB
MFDIGWSELVVIGVVALIAIGPKELPGVLRAVGNWMGKIRRMASEFQGQFQEAMREAEMADLKKSVDEMTDTAKSYTNFDPIGMVRNEIESATADKPPAASAEAAAPTTTEATSEAAPAAVPDTAPPAPEAASAPADTAASAPDIKSTSTP